MTEMTIADYLDRALSETPGKSASELARIIGIKPNGISMMRTKKIPVPIKHLPIIADYLGVDLVVLMRLALGTLLGNEMPPETRQRIDTALSRICSAEEALLLEVMRARLGPESLTTLDDARRNRLVDSLLANL
ncbi:helix-turn-helix domain-containing protein [Lacibacterium aquatile]|uniref:Helix-turn-helix domain-containing protein n=1 Tax=Lacibacterium aquatile TaxID=1168082 RepID=A0ABW5DWX9_9PROT